MYGFAAVWHRGFGPAHGPKTQQTQSHGAFRRKIRSDDSTLRQKPESPGPSAYKTPPPLHISPDSLLDLAEALVALICNASGRIFEQILLACAAILAGTEAPAQHPDPRRDRCHNRRGSQGPFSVGAGLPGQLGEDLQGSQTAADFGHQSPFGRQLVEMAAKGIHLRELLASVQQLPSCRPQ